ncbi:beta-ketoacyl-[acyl-carrier-protein] synthase family protein [Corynebacterium belfantii]|uniref:beta-ketoacyl-[acyl-carrier-protein] synthase family protein n=1 Tax=Corynebacterium belfantii TaxID=2014537 RepID=UPI0018D2A318|nr:beta-ketoacyl-[acyl-carrier-protein] synthase family protein [Corynebacterium belfantii]MBG9350261.1 beta-ketoacyl-[acyl-carrier-protein] synthase family protein [Corynebacterium belfantii]
MEKVLSEPIAVTGMGIVLPGTANREDFWENISAGRSQVSWLTRFDGTSCGLSVHVSAEITTFDHRRYLPQLPDKYAAKYSREILITMSAVADALRDAGLSRNQVAGPRLSIIQSSSRGPLEWWRGAISGTDGRAFSDRGAMFRGLAGCPASLSAIYLGAQGLVTTVSSACVGGHHALGLAMDQLRSGRADVVLAGGHEFPILEEVAQCYTAMGRGVLSREVDDPQRAVKPYHRDRDGFALGEGAVTLCLERESDARARGAKIYGFLLAHVPLNEANHGTSMDLEGDVTAGVLARALREADRCADEVGFVCGHGTATRYNDLAEVRALRKLYSGKLSGALPPHGSNKAIYGHTFGMAGVINVAATSLALFHGVLPKTANLDVVDPECGTDHIAEGPRPTDTDLAMSMSFAFGSQTSVMTLGRAS